MTSSLAIAEEIARELANGQKISAIKMARSHISHNVSGGMGLKEAKDLIDRACARTQSGKPTVADYTNTVLDEFVDMTIKGYYLNKATGRLSSSDPTLQSLPAGEAWHIAARESNTGSVDVSPMNQLLLKHILNALETMVTAQHETNQLLKDLVEAAS